jgi:hypothetical protein
MRLYHFTSEIHGLQSIRDKKLKIALFNRVNDPFEFQSLQNEDEDSHDKLLKIKELLSYDYGFISLSEFWTHPLMWSHYAEKHSGICLGFEVADSDELKKVTYQAQRPRLFELKEGDGDAAEMDAYMKLLTLKFHGWQYEAEYRFFSSLEKGDTTKDLYFRDYSKEFTLREVIVGIQSRLPFLKLQKVLGDQIKTVECFKAKLHSTEFNVTRAPFKL